MRNAQHDQLWRTSRRHLEAILRTGRKELPLLFLLLFIAVTAWGFAAIADAVIEGDTREFDRAVLLAMRNPIDETEPRGPRWLEEIARDCTALGGLAILTFLTVAAAGYLWLRGKLRTMLFLLGSIGSGTLASTLLKQSFDRPRPELVPHDTYVYTASFPSGHSMMAAIVFLTIAALLAKVESQPAIKAYLLFVATLLTIAVGVSRVYLGVHWPTDVFAGWLGGGAWAAACWTLANLLQRAGSMDSTPARRQPET